MKTMVIQKVTPCCVEIGLVMMCCLCQLFVYYFDVNHYYSWLEVRLVVVSGQLGPVQQLPAVVGQLLLQLSYAP